MLDDEFMEEEQVARQFAAFDDFFFKGDFVGRSSIWDPLGGLVV